MRDGNPTADAIARTRSAQAPCAAGAEIKDEIAYLPAVRIARVVGGEQRYRLAIRHQRVFLRDDVSHRPLAVLVGPIALKNLRPTHCGGVLTRAVSRNG